MLAYGISTGLMEASAKVIRVVNEALRRIQAGLEERGYRTAPFLVDGALSRGERRDGVVWYDPAAPISASRQHRVLHNLQLSLYLGPPSETEVPIYGFHIDHYPVGDGRLLRGLQRALGIPEHVDLGDPPRRMPLTAVTEAPERFNTELYVLEHEVPVFAEYLPGWVEALHRGAADLPAPPVRMHEEQRVWFYSFSWAAMAAYEAWEGVVEANDEGTAPATIN